MLKLIEIILHQFRICFKREETFRWFVIIMAGMLHFFRSKAYHLECIKSKWQDIVLEHINPAMIDGNIILIGDHITW